MLAVILCSILAGVCITLLTEILLCYKWFTRLPITTPSWKTQTEPYVLPKTLQTTLTESTESDRKETCLGVNLLIQFLFQELKDTRRIRRWVMRRMQKEFVELLQQTTTGKLLENITVRDFNLGSTFPIIRHATTQSVDVNDDNVIESVALLLDLSYNGRFQLAVDVDMVFGRSAYLSVMVTKMIGVARLQFIRVPFTHWSFAFVEDPTLEFEVESQLEGRPIAQLASIIINQIRKAVRKKHTLPFYKLRYQPFFTMPTPPITTAQVNYDGLKLTTGHLSVNVVSCSRLLQIPSQNATVYCSLSIEELPWLEMMVRRRKQWETKDILICRTSGQAVGMTFIETHIAEKCEELVTITAVTPGSPADIARIFKNDVLVSINGIKVLSSKQAARLIKQSPDRILVCVERSAAVAASNLRPPTEGASADGFSLTAERDDEDVDSLTDSTSYSEDQHCAAVEMADNDCAENAGSENTHFHREALAVDPPSKATMSAPKSETIAVSFVAKSDGLLISNSSQSSLGKVPPVARKIINSSSALFQRKKQAVLDQRRLSNSPAASVASTTVVSAVSTSSSGGSTSNSISPMNLVKSVTSSSSTFIKPALTTPAVSLSALDRPVIVTTSGPATVAPSSKPMVSAAPNTSITATYVGMSTSVSANSLSTGADTTSLSSDVSLAALDPDSMSMDQADDRPSASDPDAVSSELIRKPRNGSPVAGKPSETMVKGSGQESRKTRIVKVCSNPAFNQKFDFVVDDSKSYLNVCVWCRLPQKLDKQQRFVKPQKDLVIGHTSIALADVAINSLLTLQGDFTETFTLLPPEAKNDLTKNNNANLSTHPGFNDKFCYGDVTLTLQLRPSVVLSKDDKQRFEKHLESVSGNSNESTRFQMQLPVNNETTVSGVTPVISSEKRHDFKMVQFQSATYCNFCSKKVWFKSAFQCSLCLMVCHKKCVDRCQSVTECSRIKRKPVNFSTSPVDKESTKIISTDGSSDRKRISSALDESHSDSESGKPSSNTEINATLLPRPKSSNSLPYLLDEPTIEQLMSAALVNESDYKLVKLFERAKKVENNDELVVTKAKKMGKELFAELDPESRKLKLDSFISKLQSEIDSEAEHRAELARSIRGGMVDKKTKSAVEAKIEKSDEKLDSMTVLMLHYCAGLQHCLDQEEAERQKQVDDTFLMADKENDEFTKACGLIEENLVASVDTPSPEVMEQPDCDDVADTAAAGCLVDSLMIANSDEQTTEMISYDERHESVSELWSSLGIAIPDPTLQSWTSGLGV